MSACRCEKYATWSACKPLGLHAAAVAGVSYFIVDFAVSLTPLLLFWEYKNRLSFKGKDSTQDEKAASAIHAVRLDNELGGRAVQVRVVQGYEPRHFLRIFQGKIIRSPNCIFDSARFLFWILKTLCSQFCF